MAKKDARRPYRPPPGFPVFTPACVMAFIGRVMVLHIEAADEASFEIYITHLARAIDARKPGDDIIAFYDVPRLSEFTATQRKRLAEVVAARRELLAASTKKFIMATQSPFVRGMLQAIWWLVPPPFPYMFAKDAEQAIQLIAKDEPDVDPILFARDYAVLVDDWRTATSAER